MLLTYVLALEVPIFIGKVKVDNFLHSKLYFEYMIFILFLKLKLMQVFISCLTFNNFNLYDILKPNLFNDDTHMMSPIYFSECLKHLP